MTKYEILKNLKNDTSNEHHELWCFLNGKWGGCPSGEDSSYGSHWSDYIEEHCFPDEDEIDEDDPDWDDYFDYNSERYDYVQEESIEMYVYVNPNKEYGNFDYGVIVLRNQESSVMTLVDMIKDLKSNYPKMDLVLVDENFRLISSLR